MKHNGGLNDLVGWLLGWLWDHKLRRFWEKRIKTTGCFSKEDGSKLCHPLGYGVMKGNYMQQLAKSSKGQVIYTKGAFRYMMEWNIKGRRWKKERQPSFYL